MGTPHSSSAFLLYELAQVAELERFWSEHPEEREEVFVVALSLDIEEALRARDIPFSSGRHYRPIDTRRFVLAEEWAASLFEGKVWEWFQYRGQHLKEIFSISVQLYFIQVLYYVAIINTFLARHPEVGRLVVFPSLQQVPLRGRILESKRIGAVVACARAVAVPRDVEVVVPPLSRGVEQRKESVFVVKQILIGIAVTVWNLVLTLLRPQGTPRILASDYWKNVSPIMACLPKGELMLFDRSEALAAGIRNVFRYRIRLYNFDSFSLWRRASARKDAERAYKGRWESFRDDDLLNCLFDGVPLRSLLREICDDLIKNEVPAILRDIDGAYEMLTRLSPDVVVLRASVSAQTHFCILAMVARSLKIPSVEFQHGVEYLGSGSISKRHSAEYVAVYGQAVQDEFASLGFSREKFPIVGSPRFDAYKEETARVRSPRHEGNGLSILCIGFTVSSPWFYDDYDLEEYYQALAKTLEKIPQSSVVIKLRPGDSRKGYAAIDALFAHVPHTFAEYEPFSELFATADVVVSYYSTTVLEALQFGKPVIVFGGQAMEYENIRFHFTRSADAGGLRIAETATDLEMVCRSLANDRSELGRLSHGATQVLSRFYLFDGKASARIVELIKRLSYTI